MVEGDGFGMSARPGCGRAFADDFAIQHNDGPDRRTRRDAALDLFGQFKCSIEWIGTQDRSAGLRPLDLAIEIEVGPAGGRRCLTLVPAVQFLRAVGAVDLGRRLLKRNLADSHSRIQGDRQP